MSENRSSSPLRAWVKRLQRWLFGKPTATPLCASRLALEQLEERTVLTTGTTIITHGYSLPVLSSIPLALTDPLAGSPASAVNQGWVREIQGSIGNRVAATGRSIVNLDYTFETGTVSFTGGSSVPIGFTPANNTQYVLAVDWRAASSRSDSGSAEAVGDGLYAALHRLGLDNTSMHFIGHSFGTVVNSEAIQRLGYFGHVQVHQMTTLDPHDWDEGFGVDTGARMPDVQVWSNIDIADNYFSESGGTQNPHGRPLFGAFNVDLTDLPGFHDSMAIAGSHSRVHDYYVNTINPSLIDSHSGVLDSYDENDWRSPSTSITIRANPISGTADQVLTGPDIRGWGYSESAGSQSPGSFLSPYIASVSQNSKIDPSGTSLGPPYHIRQDVGIDPPGYIFDGDFAIEAIAQMDHVSAAYQGTAIMAKLPLQASNYAADLIVPFYTSLSTLSHRPSYFPGNTNAFSFSYYLKTVDQDDALAVKFEADDGTVLTYSASSLLRNNSASASSTIFTPYTGGNVAISEVNLPGFSGLLNKNVKVTFTLTKGGATSADIYIDNLDLGFQSITVTDGEARIFHDGGSSPLVFTSAAQGSVAGERTFVVSNTGSSSITLGAVVASSGFVITQQLAVGTLLPHHSTTFKARLNTASVGTFSGNLSFTTTVPGKESFDVRVTGTVTQSQPNLADLTLQSVQVLNSAGPGQNLSIRTEVSNAGNGTSGGYNLNFILQSVDNSGLTYILPSVFRTNSTLASGAQDSNRDSLVQLPANLTAGSYTLVADLVPTDPTQDARADNHQQSTISALTIGATGSANKFRYPIGPPRTGSTVTQHFGNSFDTNFGHLATDFRGGEGTEVVASADGVVTQVYRPSASWGYVVIIRHPGAAWGLGEDIYTMYAHVVPEVSIGQSVTGGQRIATVGPTALGSTGPHLHFEIRKGADAGTQAGSGYLGRTFDRSAEPIVTRTDDAYQITWLDPEAFLQAHLTTAPPIANQVDLDPATVDAPSAATVGTTTAIFTRVQNLWPTASGSYQVRYVLSTDPNVTLRDRELKTITRTSVAGLSESTWTESVSIPADVQPGTYYIGVLVDPNNTLIEQNDSNNDQADANSILILGAATSKPDLMASSLRIARPQTSYVWNQSLDVKVDIRNAGDAASNATLYRLVLVDDPFGPTNSVVLGNFTLPALQPGYSTGTTKTLTLPASRPAAFGSGPLYLRVEVDPNNTVAESNELNNQGQSNDWVSLPLPSANATTLTPKADLVGAGFTYSPARSTFLWGESLTVNPSIRNLGSVDSDYFSAEIVLSKDPTFSRDNTSMRTLRIINVAAGQTIVQPVTLTLPPAPPGGLSSGRWYLGIILDSENAVDESQESNNRGVGLDFASLYIVSPPTLNLPPEPTIASFNASPGTPVVRGEKVTLTASGVSDDKVVNEVVFRLDTNQNGNFDDTDLYLAHGSKDGPVFTATVTTDSRWPTGNVTILARATDNDGLVSHISSASQSIIGLSSGPFPDDALENNDSIDTAAYLGAGIDISISNLALAQNDPDYFLFDLIGSATQIKVDINFTQEVFQGAGQPVGDLTLQLQRLGSGSTAFSNSSTSADGHEQIILNSGGAGAYVAAGRYIVLVQGNASWERNPNYSLHIQLTPAAGAPVVDSLTATPSAVVQGENMTFSVPSVSGVAPAQIDGVHFYVDFNSNGQIDFDTEYLGSDWGLGDGPGGAYTITKSTASWGLGSQKVIALASPLNGPTSLAETMLVTILPNNPPSLDLLSAPATAIQGGSVTLTAINAVDSDPGGSVASVDFTLDSNSNGILDAEDYALGHGTFSAGNAVLTTPTEGWPLGSALVFATPKDNLGLIGNSVAASLTLVPSTNQAPTIGSLTAPEFILKGDVLTLVAQGVSDPNNDTLQVGFYFDADEDGALGEGDTLLGMGTQNGTNWTLPVFTTSWPQGVKGLFAHVKDNGIPSYSAYVAASVTVIDNGGPRVVSQSPTGAVQGSISSIRVTFNEPIDPATFTLADIASFTGPSGALTTASVTAVSGSNGTQFDIAFARQTALGSYTLVLGPNITDEAGNALDQDSNGILGQTPADQYSASFTVSLAPAQYNWSVTAGASALDWAQAITRDSSGNLYVTGTFSGTVDFDPGAGTTSRTSAGFNDIFVAKYSAAGALIWVQAIGGTNGDSANAIAVDTFGSVYITGEFRTSVDFDPGAGSTVFTTSPSANADVFVLKLSSVGNFSWARQFTSNTSNGSDAGYSITLDASNNVYIAGGFYGTCDFDPGASVTNLTSLGDEDGFVVMLNSSGNFGWAKSMGGTATDQTEGVTVDASGNVYTTGWFSATANFNPSGAPVFVTTNGSQDIFITKHDSSGALTWVKNLGSSSSDRGRDIVVDGGNLYVTGEFFGTADFDPSAAVQSLTSQSQQDGFLLKLDTNAGYVWARDFGGSVQDAGYAIFVDANHNVYTSGRFTGTADFNPGGTSSTRTSSGGDDVFVMKHNASGQLQWVVSTGGSTDDLGTGVTADGAGNIYASGFFANTADFDPAAGIVNKSSAGNNDAFVWALTEPQSNDPPVIVLVSNQTVNEGSTLSFTVTATDTTARTYSLDPGAPVGASINATTGAFTWTPSEGQGPGIFPITVRVTDSGSPVASNTTSFNVSVNEVNLAPSLAAIANQTIYEGVQLHFTASANDADLPSNTLTYSLVSPPAGASINPATGEFTWTPTESQGPGVFSVTVRVTDNGSPNLNTTRTFSVDVREANLPPVLQAVANQTVQFGGTLTLTPLASDPDMPTNNLTFSLDSGAPAGMSINATTGQVLWTPLASQIGNYTLSIRVTDDGLPPLFAVGTANITVSSNATLPLHVSSINATNSGFVAQFNRPVNANAINLYDQNGLLGVSDVTLVGASTGPVRGSLVFDSSNSSFTFLKSGPITSTGTGAAGLPGTLAPDTYTLTLRSSATDGFVDGANNALRNANGTAGDYIAHFTVNAPANGTRTLSIPDFVRGAGQAVNVPASANTGLPVILSNGNNSSSAQFTFNFDPNLLSIAGFTSPIAGAVTSLTVIAPGVINVGLISASPFSTVDGPIVLGNFIASVPSSAPYAHKEILHLSNVQVFDASTFDPFPTMADDGVHVAGYFGDTNGNRGIAANDASLVLRVSTSGANSTFSGFATFQTADPVVLGDFNLNGAMTAADASSLLRHATGTLNPNIPAIPANIAGLGAIDPQVSIGNVTTTAGSNISIPVNLFATENIPSGLTAADIAISYDPSVLTIAATGAVSAGSLLNGFIVSYTILSPGSIHIGAIGGPTSGITVGSSGTLFDIVATVAVGASAGNSTINLRATDSSIAGVTALTDGNGFDLILIPAPTNLANDTVDGVVIIQGAGNVAPTLTPAIGNLTYTENAAAVPIDSTFVVADDGANLANATISFAGGYVAGQDLLNFTDQNGITGTFNVGNGTLTLTGGANLTTYQNALRSITYLNNSENPTTANRTLSIVVNDGSLSSSAVTHNLSIIAVNDAPVIAANQSFSLNENSGNGAFVGGLVASDVDGPSLQNWTITGGNTGNAFAINPSNGAITIANSTMLDREARTGFTLQVTVSDGINTSLAQNLTINLNDVNDVTPIVNANQTFALNENSANTNVVGAVLATDGDVTPTTFQSWAITGGNTGGAFSINATTGQITVANNTILDREARAGFSLQITVSDGVNNSSAQNVTINLNDVNDVTPIVSANQTFALNENSANTNVVGAVVATDGDVTPTTFQSWAITGGNTGGAFSINATTGQITVANSTMLDREARAGFSLQITVSDGVDNSSAQNVTINLNDVNDVTPSVTANQTFAISDLSANGSVVGSLAATDGDVTPTTFQNWTLTGGNTSGNFAINAASGQITVASNSSLSGSFPLQVTVSDGVHTSAAQTVTINVTSGNFNPPTVTANQTFALNENSGNSTVVGTIVATDPDVGTTFQNWSITSGNTNGAFSINTSTGQLTVSNSTMLDRETRTGFTLQVTVSDGVHTSSAQNVTINLNDVNDVTPFVTGNQTFALNENSANTTGVGAVLATDGDITPTAFQNWAITGGNTGGAFSINATTGQITVANSTMLDREARAGFSLQITLSDGVNNSSAQNVTINLNDVNDVTPVVTANQTFTLNENSANTTVVGANLTATDGDVTPALFSNWTITGGNTNGAFSINTSTGQLTVANSTMLDREARTGFILQVTVSDGVHTSSAQNVTINLNDVNDVTPFVTGNQTFALNENSANTTGVGAVLATDGDITPPTFQSWAITGGNSGGAFGINATTGQLRVANSTMLNREATAGFTLQVTVSDGVHTSSAQNVTVNLNDLNDVTPVVSANQTFTLAENTGNGIVLGANLTATDGDASPTTFQNWSITGGNTGGAFAINATTGQLRVANSTMLDREARAGFTLQVAVSDGVHTSSTQNVTVSLNDVNDLTPVVTGNQTFAMSNSSANGATVGSVLAADGDVTPTTFSTWTITGGNTGGAFSINGTTGQLTVANNVALTGNFTLQVTVSDGVHNSTAQNVAVNVTIANTAPTLTPAANSLSYLENAGSLTLDNSFGVNDDGGSLAGATLTFTGGYVNGQDALAFSNQSGIVGSFNASAGIFRLTGNASVANYQYALRSITYTNNSDNPSTANRTLSIVVSDGSLASTPVTRTIAVAAVNDAPVVTTTLGNATFNVGAGPVAIDSTLSLADVDSLQITGANVAITANFTPAQDVLAFNNQSGITGDFNSTTGILTLAGSASLINYQSALRSITFSNASGSPSLQPRTVSFVVSDGAAANNLSIPATRNVRIFSSSNLAPAFVAGNMTFSCAANTNSATLNASDADPLTYSATIDSVGHYLQSTYNLTYDPARFNYGSQQEKWFTAPSGNPNDPVRYFLLPNGDFYQWNRATNRALGTLINTISPVYYADQTRIGAEPAGSGPLTFTVNATNGQLTFDNPLHYEGQFRVTATVSDGSLPVTRIFFVKFTNLAPVLNPISDVSMPPSQNTIVVSLSAGDPESDSLIYSATVQSQAQALDAQINFTAAAGPNNGSVKLGEHWVKSGGGQWFYILPNGDLFQWDGTPYVSQGTFLANVGANIYATPNLLVNPAAAAAVSISGANLTVDPNLGFVGNLIVTAKVTDVPRGNFDIKTFLVTVAPKPTLTQPADVNVTGTAPIPITISATDPSGLPLTYRVTNEAAVLQATFGLSSTGAAPASIAGAKWFVGAGSAVYYYLLANGDLHRYDTRAVPNQKDTFVRTIDPRYYVTPGLLDGQSAQTQFTYTYNSGILTVTPRAGFTGKLVLTIFANNGVFEDSKTFAINVR